MDDRGGTQTNAIEAMTQQDIDDSKRRARVNRKVAEAFNILADAHEKYVTEPGKTHAGDCILFSGGNDSTVLAHIFQRYADWAVHINTGICVLDEDADDEVSAAAVYVRERCAEWGLALIEETGDDYDRLVIEHGFPGPAHHFKMYQRLKERGLRKVRKRLVTNGRKERVIFIAGRRRQESERRKDIPAMERDGSIVWVSPLVHWTAEDMADYRKVYDVALSPVSAELHMSGECLCGAFAKAGELDEIKFWRPRTWGRIKRLEAAAIEAGNCKPEQCQWGWGAYRGERKKADAAKLGPLCSQCTFSFDGEDAA